MLYPFLISLSLFLGLFSFVSAAVLPVSSDECNQMIQKKVITAANPVPCSRLRLVTFNYMNLLEKKQDGVVMVMDAVAVRVQTIFDSLYQMGFPLHKAVLIDYYGGDDQASMNDGNTSAFNGRSITGGEAWSMHAYGAAIDINPWQNPFVSFDEKSHVTVVPAQAVPQYLNRFDYRPDHPKRFGLAEVIVDIFANNGFFTWGGYWDNPIDYQHFEIANRAFVERMAVGTPEMAYRMVEESISAYQQCMRATTIQPHAAARAYCVEQVVYK